MKTIYKFFLKSFLMIVVSCSVVVCQITETESIERASLIISDYFKITNYKHSKNLSLKYQESWLVNNSEITTEHNIYQSNSFLKHEENSIGDGVFFSRNAVLNNDFYFRNYLSNQGKDSIKLDLSKSEEKNTSEIRLLKWKASTLFFPITLQYSANNEIKFNYLGIAETKDKKAYVLDYQQNQNANIKILFDIESNLPIMWKYSLTSKDGKVNIYDYYLSDYKILNGVKISTKIEVYLNQKFKQRFTISDFQNNREFDPKFFEM